MSQYFVNEKLNMELTLHMDTILPCLKLKAGIVDATIS
jgi:hypothetical protein